MMNRHRPLSPHLQIYRFNITSVLSISHRMSGVFLNLLVVFLCIGIIAFAAGHYFWEAYYNVLTWPPVTILVMLGVFGFYLHLLNGLRHLIWDIGLGFGKFASRISGWCVLLGSFFLTWLNFSVVV